MSMPKGDKKSVPALNPLTFKQIVTAEGLVASKASQEDRRYKVKILKQLLPCYGMSRNELEVFFDGRTDNPWDVLISISPSEEMKRLWVERHGRVTIGDLTLRTRATSAFTRYREIIHKFSHPAGLIFPVLSYGDWIMHSLGCPVDRSRGLARIVIAATSAEVPDLWVEPLAQFIYTRKGISE